MASAGGQSSSMTASKRVRRWIEQSVASASRITRDLKVRHLKATDTTVAGPPGLTHKATQSDAAINDSVLPSKPLIAARPPGEGFDPIPTPDTDQIPNDEDIQTEIVEVTQQVEPEHPGDASDPRAQLQDPPTYTPPAAESEEVSIPLVSSDQRMNLILREFLGEGSFSNVVSADWEEGCRQVAVKVSHKIYISGQDCIESGLNSLKNELVILKRLRQSRDRHEPESNFFPELLKSWQDFNNVYFVTALYPWNLEQLREASPDWDASAEDKVLWAAEMILGVQALHRLRILHRDIKPANIFITAEKHIIIGDYGLSRSWMGEFYANFPTSFLKARDTPGTILYIAPEVVDGFYEGPENTAVRKFANYGFEADIWSLGVTICDSWRWGKPLFGIEEEEEDQDSESAIPPKILKMDVVPVVKKIVDGHPIWHLITRMLDKDPKDRIGFREVFAHPVFGALDWNRVANLGYTPTWTFPKVGPSKPQKSVQEAIEFTSLYRPPESSRGDEAGGERTEADWLDMQQGLALGRAMASARDWISKQPGSIKDQVLGGYDFDWTASEFSEEDKVGR